MLREFLKKINQEICVHLTVLGRQKQWSSRTTEEDGPGDCPRFPVEMLKGYDLEAREAADKHETKY